MIYTIKEPVNHCVAHAVSILRTSIGYNEPIEQFCKVDKLVDLRYLFSCLPEFFYRHKFQLYTSKALYPIALEELGDTVPISLMDDITEEMLYGNYVFLFDYYTAGNPMSHCVVGFPILLPGTDGQFVLRISLD